MMADASYAFTLAKQGLADALGVPISVLYVPLGFVIFVILLRLVGARSFVGVAVFARCSVFERGSRCRAIYPLDHTMEIGSECGTPDASLLRAT